MSAHKMLNGVFTLYTLKTELSEVKYILIQTKIFMHFWLLNLPYVHVSTCRGRLRPALNLVSA